MGNFAARAASAPTLASLDDGDLANILSLVGRQHGPTLTRVCHKWRELVWSERELWRSLRLARPSRCESRDEEAAAAARQLGMLRRVSRFVQEIEIAAMHRGPQPAGEAPAWDAAVLLRALRPEALRELVLRHAALRANAPTSLPDAALEALPRLGGLTRLELASTRLAPRPAAAALRQLHQLRQLSCHMAAISTDTLQAAAQLPALTRLELASPPAQLPELLPELLGAVTQLRELACLNCGVLPAGTITAVSEQLLQLETLVLTMSLPRDELPLLTQLPSLRRLELCDRRWGTGSLQLPRPAAFAGLQSYRIWREAEGGCFLVASAQLRSCSFAGGALEIGDLRQPPSLQELLEALLPGGARAAAAAAAAPALTGLIVRHGGLGAEVVQACPLLDGLRLLHLRQCWAADGPVRSISWVEDATSDLLAMLQLVLGQAPALEDLGLWRCALAPPGSSGSRGAAALDLSGTPRLRRLALHSRNPAATACLLPAAFPAGLEEVELAEAYPPPSATPSGQPPAPAMVPPGLAACTALRRLRLSGLRLQADLPSHVLQGLTELELTRGAVDRLPPSLSAATALACLNLSHNAALALSHADAKVLQGLPQLRALQAEHTATQPTFWTRLQASMPRVQAAWGLHQAWHRLLRRSDRQWSVLVIGVGAAGASTVLQALQPGLGMQPIHTSVPFVGTHVESVGHNNVTVLATRIDRSMGSSFLTCLPAQPWFQGLQGLVFVVDSSNRDTLIAARPQLTLLLQWEDALLGLPLLLMANKQDKAVALEPQDVAQRLGVAALCQRRRWRAQGSCAATGEGLFEGFDWLTRCMAGVD